MPKIKNKVKKRNSIKANEQQAANHRHKKQRKSQMIPSKKQTSASLPGQLLETPKPQIGVPKNENRPSIMTIKIMSCFSVFKLPSYNVMELAFIYFCFHQTNIRKIMLLNERFHPIMFEGFREPSYISPPYVHIDQIRMAGPSFLSTKKISIFQDFFLFNFHHFFPYNFRIFPIIKRCRSDTVNLSFDFSLLSSTAACSLPSIFVCSSIVSLFLSSRLSHKRTFLANLVQAASLCQASHLLSPFSKLPLLLYQLSCFRNSRFGSVRLTKWHCLFTFCKFMLRDQSLDKKHKTWAGFHNTLVGF